MDEVPEREGVTPGRRVDVLTTWHDGVTRQTIEHFVERTVADRVRFNGVKVIGVDEHCRDTPAAAASS